MPSTPFLKGVRSHVGTFHENALFSCSILVTNTRHTLEAYPPWLGMAGWGERGLPALARTGQWSNTLGLRGSAHDCTNKSHCLLVQYPTIPRSLRVDVPSSKKDHGIFNLVFTARCMRGELPAELGLLACSKRNKNRDQRTFRNANLLYKL